MREQMAAGRYASASELVRDALRSLEREEIEFQEHLASLRTRVEASIKDPRPSISSDEVKRRLEERHKAALKAHRSA
jgi:antitoxin ParD1/3/4